MSSETFGASKDLNIYKSLSIKDPYPSSTLKEYVPYRVLKAKVIPIISHHHCQITISDMGWTLFIKI
jgi:hypothetical protein